MKRDDYEKDVDHLYAQAIMHRLGLNRRDEPSATPLEELRAKLDDPDPAVRAAAVRELAIHGEQTPVEWLLLALHDTDWFVRARAVRALGQRRSAGVGTQFVASLLAALQDDDASVRAAALSVLSERVRDIPDEAVAGTLLDDDWHVREMAAQALPQLHQDMPETLWQTEVSSPPTPALVEDMSTLPVAVPMGIHHHNGHTGQPLPPIQKGVTTRIKDQRMKQPDQPRRFSALSRRLGLVAAMLCAALLVASMAIVFNNLHARKGSTTTGSSHISTVTPAATHPSAIASAPGIYVTSLQTAATNRFSRLNIHNGSVIWQQNMPQEYPSVIVDGVMYLATEDATTYDGYVIAINAGNGRTLWQANLGSDYTKTPVTLPGQSSGYIFTDLGEPSSAVVANGIVYVTRTNGKVFALRASNGKRLWIYDAHAQAYDNGTNYNPNPVVVGGNTVYGTVHNKAFALNATTGEPLWSASVDQSQMFNAPQFMNGVVYTSSDSVSLHTAGTYDHFLYAYSTSSGSLIWHKLVKTTAMPLTLVSTAANGDIYYVSGNNLYALQASSGNQLWSRDMQGSVDFDAPVVVDNTLYISTNEVQGGPKPMLFALDATSGSVLWQRQYNVLALAETGGAVYVGADNALLLALDPATGKTFWQRSFDVPVKDKMGNPMGRIFDIIPVS